MKPFSLQKEIETVKSWRGVPFSGSVTHIVGLLLESAGPSVHLGELCHVYNRHGEPVPCEVVGFKERKVLLMCLGDMTHIAPGAEVCPTGEVPMVGVSMQMCGRVLDGLGNPIDGKGPLAVDQYYPVHAEPPHALRRHRITKVLQTGIRSIDTTCTAGRGQRFGIFAGSGVGKSTVLSMMARMSDADINVIALIGERGREVREFIERDLGPEGLARSVVVVVTSDRAALLRAKGASAATAIAEYFRDKGKSVVLMMDSVTRYAMALREIGLAVGEPPTTKGYTPSVFSMLPKLLERTGNSEHGSITGIYTILVEGDDMNDPVADTVRGILDGHIVLSRKLATMGMYPAVDVLESLSRVMKEIVDERHLELANQLREVLQTWKEAEDLINIGAYAHGSNPKIDHAISVMTQVREFLRQGSEESTSFEEMLNHLESLLQ